MIGFAVSTVAVILAAWFGYVAGRAGRPRVPAGTPYTGDSPLLDRTHRVQTATGYALDALAGVPRGCRPVAMTDAQLRAHVVRDDAIYGRNG